ncbi:hypothetical protein QOZ80_7BG0604660 [Eleusine coracana subsp. coracana]|nr:hypothetical protein QOZ80_7BG0604660 [Eleusine coracana subsp. coracana]
MRNVLLLVAVVMAIYVTTPTVADPIDINAPDIQNLGRWAVTEHNKKAHDRIKFKKVVGGYHEFITQEFFSLIIDAWNNAGKDARYDAGVAIKDIPREPTFVSFDPDK